MSLHLNDGNEKIFTKSSLQNVAKTEDEDENQVIL